MCGKSHPQYHREAGRTVRMNVDQSLVSGRANRTRAIHEPPLRARPGTPQHVPGCTPVARAARHPGRTGRGRFTNRPYGPARHAAAYAGDACRCCAARDPGRTGRGRFTNRPYGPAWHAAAYAGIHAGFAPRDIPDARVVGGSRTAPTGQPASPSPLPPPSPFPHPARAVQSHPLPLLTLCIR